MPAPRPERRAAVLGALVVLAAVVVVRWPVVAWPDAQPLDPNTALHVVVARDLARWHATPGRLWSLAWPDGMPLRILAWPVALLAVPIEWFASPVRAFNLAVTAWMLLQGLAAWLFARAAGWDGGSRAVAVVGALLSPAMLLNLGNGNYENVAAAALAGAVWAGGRPGAAGAFGTLAAVLLAGAGSPYQAIPAAVLAGASAVVTGPPGIRAAIRRLLRVGTAAALALLLVASYFRGVTAEASTASAGPASTKVVRHLSLVGLVDPHPVQPVFDEVALTPDAWDAQLQAMRFLPRRVTWSPLARDHQVIDTHYLGIALLALGIAASWRHRREPVVRALALGGSACLLLAMGPWLSVFPAVATPIWLPWAALARLPGASDLVVTERFVTGTAVALALLAARLTSGRGAAWKVAAACLLAADALLLAPAHWPSPAAVLYLPYGGQPLPEGPMVVFPGPPRVPPRTAQRLALVADRPVSWVEDEDRLGEWLREDPIAGIRTVAELSRGEFEAAGGGAPTHRTCHGSMCLLFYADGVGR